ncbi:MAG: ABC transporter permease [Candidatus Dormibacteria bacterium]|jgi:ABC-2 type transport system permease protein
MWAMIVKEFRQLRRDRRTVAMMVALPILLLVIFGYAASFNVTSIPTTVSGPEARLVAGLLRAPFDVTSVDVSGTRAQAVTALTDGDTAAAVVTGPQGATVLLDGTQLFTAQAALRAVDEAGAHLPPGFTLQAQVLFNPGLTTSAVMVPGLAAMILLFIGTVITSLGVVRERQAGTLEQLAVMPFRPRDVFLGKIAPYFAVGAVDMILVVAVGMALFDVPFRGSILVFGLGALLFLFVALGIGVLISSVSQNQGQAIQLALMTLLPQIMLSGLIFPLTSMAAGVRWIGYLLPLTYFVEIARGVMLRATPITSLWQPFLYLAVIGAVVVTLSTLRFRRLLGAS